MSINSRKRGMSFVIHGHSKVGKTTLALTAPYPRLLLDTEAAAHLLPNEIIWWDPMSEPAPIADGTWDTCVVDTDNFEVAKKAYEVIKSGRHQFRSFIVDSISELQAKVFESVGGRDRMRQQDWGILLSKLGFFCRDLRDLARLKNNSIEAVVLTAMTKRYDVKEDGTGGIYKPFLQGQISAQLPYWFDVVGYYFKQAYFDQATQQQSMAWRMMVSKSTEYEAGNRVPSLAGMDFINYPNIEQIIDSFFGPRENSYTVIETPVATNIIPVPTITNPVATQQEYPVTTQQYSATIEPAVPTVQEPIQEIVQTEQKTVELSTGLKMSLPKINKMKEQE